MPHSFVNLRDRCVRVRDSDLVNYLLLFHELSTAEALGRPPHQPWFEEFRRSTIEAIEFAAPGCLDWPLDLHLLNDARVLYVRTVIDALFHVVGRFGDGVSKEWLNERQALTGAIWPCDYPMSEVLRTAKAIASVFPSARAIRRRSGAVR